METFLEAVAVAAGLVGAGVLVAFVVLVIRGR